MLTAAEHAVAMARASATTGTAGARALARDMVTVVIEASQATSEEIKLASEGSALLGRVAALGGDLRMRRIMRAALASPGQVAQAPPVVPAAVVPVNFRVTIRTPGAQWFQYRCVPGDLATLQALQGAVRAAHQGPLIPWMEMARWVVTAVKRGEDRWAVKLRGEADVAALKAHLEQGGEGWSRVIVIG